MTMMECIFSKIIVSKSNGKRYVVLSNGLKETMFSTPLEKEEFDGLKTYDNVNIGFIVNPFDSFQTSVQTVEKMK